MSQKLVFRSARIAAAQPVATALRASLVGIVFFVASWAPAKAQEKQNSIAAAAASAAPDKLLAELDEAERLWKASQPQSYSYTVDRGSAFTGMIYEVSVHDGRCTARSTDARSKEVLRGRRPRWESVDCEGLLVTDIFAELRKEWLACPGARVEVGFDDRYGYIKEIFFDPNSELSDVFWNLTLSRFKARR